MILFFLGESEPWPLGLGFLAHFIFNLDDVQCGYALRQDTYSEPNAAALSETILRTYNIY